MELILSIDRQEVLGEVAQMTAYAGAKKDDDANAIERITTVKDDDVELMRFWDECRSEVAQAFMRLLSSEGMDGERYELRLNVSCAFDMALSEGMRLGLFAYFVQRIAGKWYVYTNKGDAGECASRAAALLNEVKEKAFYKKQPVRPRYD